MSINWNMFVSAPCEPHVNMHVMWPLQLFCLEIVNSSESKFSNTDHTINTN